MLFLPLLTQLRGRSFFPAAASVFLVAWLGTTGPGLRLPPSRPVVADTLLGTDADDVLRGTPRDDLLDGKAGDDRLIGLEGKDALTGGPGRDVLVGGPGEDILSGGDDPDWLVGGDDRDWLFGDLGDDLLEGGDGPDAIDGGEGNDRLQGNKGDDALDGNAGDDLVEGGAGNDRVEGGDGIDLLDGGDGNDQLDGGDENDVLRGGAGADSLSGADGDDDLDGGADNDVVLGDDGDDVVKGGPGADKLAGGDGNDRLDGGAGDDLLNGGEGDDVLAGLAGADTLMGHHGTDRLTGGAGNDIVQGGDGTDILDGDDGDDRLTGGAGIDVIRGGLGNDFILLRAGDVDSSATELIDGGSNRDTTRVEADSLVLSGFAGARIERRPGGEIEIFDPVTGGRYLVSRVERVVFLELVPYLAGGESLLQVVNTSADSLAGRLELRDASGKPMAAARMGDSAVAVLPIRIPARGSTEFILHAAAAGQIYVSADHPFGLALRTTLPGGSGRGVVPPARFRDEFSVPLVLDRALGTSTTLAVTTGAVGTTLQLWVMNAAGQEIENTNVDIPPRGTVVRHALELFPRLNRFEGRLAVAAGQIGAVAFHVRDGRAMPAGVSRWSSAVSPGPRRLPYLMTGGGNRFTVVVAGYDSVAGGRVAFLDPMGRPLAVDVAGVGRVSEVPFRFVDAGTLFISTTGSGPPTSATALITTERGTVTATSWVTLDRDGAVEIPGSRGLTGFVAPLRLGNTAAEAGAVTVALSAGPNPATVTLGLTDESGRPVVGGEAQVRIAASGQVVRSLGELFPRARLSQFRGSLTATSGRQPVTAAVIERGGGTAALVPLTPTP